ncbi:MAG: glycosyltransferase family 2 protein [Planctomycetaceae bacterium]
MLVYAGWILFALIAVWTVPPVLWMLSRELQPASPDNGETLPSVSVIMPARNEQAAIESSLRSVLNSAGVTFELIVVNDRSTDRTGDIIDSIAATNEHVKAVHISELPSGWLGKNHAMHIAARRATGDLLLFTDGDVMYEPTALLTAVRYFSQRGLKHLCLLPRMLPGSFLENSVVAFFGLSYAIGQQVHLVRTWWPFAYAGVGAFNLVDANFYRSFGGHERIAMDVLDDVKLGKLVKRHSGRADFLAAPKLLSLRWQPSLWGVVTGLEKNGFAALNYSVPSILLVTVLFFITMVSPFVVPWLVPLRDGSGFVACAALWHVLYGVTAVRVGGSALLFLFFPFGAWMLAFTFWRSAWITLRQGGVRWRDSFYPLSELRPGIYR